MSALHTRGTDGVTDGWTLEAWRGIRASPSGLVGLCIVGMYLVITACSPLIVRYDPNEFDVSAVLQRPSLKHVFGTDGLGRDVFTRTLLGGRIAIPLTITATVLAMTWGGLLGTFLALTGGTVDGVVMRIVDAVLSIPRLLVLLLTINALGTGPLSVILTLGFFYSIPVIRIARVAALAFVAADFVTAARARGESRLSIMSRELVPNTRDVFIVEGAMCWSSMLLAFSSLSFLGVGATPPQPDWGLMIATNRGVLAVAPWAVAFPIGAISILVIAMTLLANSLAGSVGTGAIQRIPE
jgi:peptide/nickel transport system permease protein